MSAMPMPRSKLLNLAPDFQLPLEAVTETFLILGQRGGGKTNTAAVIAEELFDKGAPVCILTPIDNWWGLKSSSDGKGAGLPIYIFGGEHADLPLEPTAGKLMADVFIEERVSAVVCTHGFSGKERAAFTTDLAERLLARNRKPLHIIVEEADAFIPQKPYPGEERMLGAMDRLIRWGRSPSGIGGTFISQRSAKINKDVTTQCSVLVAHRTMAPQDIEAIKAWFQYHPDQSKLRAILDNIASLPKGSAFFYSPAWLDYFGRVAVRRRNTFDSAATPKLGEVVITPKAATVDLKKLEKQMAATIERTKADDPKELRRQLIDLAKQMAAKPSAAPAPEKLEAQYQKGVQAERRRISGELRPRLAALYQRMKKLEAVLEGDPVGEVTFLMDVFAKDAPIPAVAAEARSPIQPERPERQPRAVIPDSEFGGPERRVLDALAELEALRIMDPQRAQVALLANYTNVNSKGFTNAMGSLSSAGLLTYPSPGTVRLTFEGRAKARDVESPLSTAELQERIIKLLDGPCDRVLRQLIKVYPKSMDRSELGEKSGYGNINSKGFTNAMGRLRSLGVIDYPSKGNVVALPILFLEGR